MSVSIKHGWKPTRKWLAAQATALGGLATMLLTGDQSLSDPEIVACITFVVQAVATYLIPNKDNPGGVPDAQVVSPGVERKAP